MNSRASKLRVPLASAFLGLVVSACSGGGSGKDKVTTGSVGPAGGEVTTSAGVRVSVPAGSIEDTVEIAITETTDSAPGGHGALTKLVHIAPEDRVFARPVSVTIPLPSGEDAADLLLSRMDGAEGFDDVAGQVVSGELTAQVFHLGTVFAAKPGDTRSAVGASVPTFVSGSAGGLVPVDLTELSFHAYVTSAGGLVALPGTGFANGTFTVPGIPHGEPYYLKVGSTWYVTDESSIDLGFATPERADIREAMDPTTTQIHMQLSNLQMWNANDILQFWSPQARVWDWGLQLDAAPPIPAGDISIDRTFILANFDFGPLLVDAAKGDRVWVGQLSTSNTTEGIVYQALRRILEVPPTFSFVDGQTVDLVGTFQDVSGQHTETFDVRSQEFWALTSEISPGTPPDGFPQMIVQGVPGGIDDNGPGIAMADFVYVTVPTTATLVSNVSWGQPATGDFETNVRVSLSVSRIYTVGSTTSGPTESGSISVEVPLADALAGPIRPRISPVQNPTINGLNLRDPQTSVGLTPTLSWAPPAVGTPTKYTVRIRTLKVNPQNPTNTLGPHLATFETTGTSLTLPPDLLIPGRSYMVRIRATDSPFSMTAPVRTDYPYSHADVLSGIFTP